MLIALDPEEVRPYSLKSDTAEEKTIFSLGTLDAQLRAAVVDGQTTYSLNDRGGSAKTDIDVSINLRNFDIVRFGLKGWTNFKGKNGVEILFDTERYNVPKVGMRVGVSALCMKRLRLEWINELADQILQDNQLSVEVSKN